MKTYQVTVDGHVYDVTVQETTGAAQMPVAPPRAATAMPQPKPAAHQPVPAAPPAPVPAAPAKGGKGHSVQAPIPGKVLKVNVTPGNTVKSGDVLLILEAMKMENDIMSPVDGKVASVHVREGDSVSTGDVLIVIE